MPEEIQDWTVSPRANRVNVSIAPVPYPSTDREFIVLYRSGAGTSFNYNDTLSEVLGLCPSRVTELCTTFGPPKIEPALSPYLPSNDMIGVLTMHNLFQWIDYLNENFHRAKHRREVVSIKDMIDRLKVCSGQEISLNEMSKKSGVSTSTLIRMREDVAFPQGRIAGKGLSPVVARAGTPRYVYWVDDVIKFLAAKIQCSSLDEFSEMAIEVLSEDYSAPSPIGIRDGYPVWMQAHVSNYWSRKNG